mgnify:CR=1 FL=1
MPEAVLGLGSNIENRELHLAEAISLIEQMEGTEIRKLSNIYETKPFDVQSEQQDYLNCCVLIHTTLSPQRLLEASQKIERKLLRVRTEYHGPRTIDVDILLYEGFTSETKELTVPHPGIRQRAFVLVPLSDIFHAYAGLGFHFKEAYDQVGKSEVFLYK